MSAQFRDYYQTLGVSKTATPAEIKSAFRKLARQFHPDTAKDKKAAEEKFKEINEAYEVLGDAEKRKRYDEYGQNWQHGPPPGGGFRGGARGPGGGFRQARDQQVRTRTLNSAAQDSAIFLNKCSPAVVDRERVSRKLHSAVRMPRPTFL